MDKHIKVKTETIETMFPLIVLYHVHKIYSCYYFFLWIIIKFNLVHEHKSIKLITRVC